MVRVPSNIVAELVDVYGIDSEEALQALVQQIRAYRGVHSGQAQARPRGDALCSADLERHSVPNIKTHAGMLYEVVDGGLHCSFTEPDLAMIYEWLSDCCGGMTARNACSAIRSDNPAPLMHE